MTRWQGLYEELTTTRYAALLGYATALTGQRATAQDLVSEALLKTFASPRRLTSAAQAESQVRTVIAHIYVDDSRRSKLIDRTARRLGWDGAPASASTRDLDPVNAALAELSPKVLACVVMRHYDDLTAAQIADRLGMKHGNVKRYLYEGAQALRVTLGTSDEGDEPEAVAVVVHKDGSR